MRSKSKTPSSKPIRTPQFVERQPTRLPAGYALPRRKPSPLGRSRNSRRQPASRVAHQIPCLCPSSGQYVHRVNQTVSRNLSPLRRGQNRLGLRAATPPPHSSRTINSPEQHEIPFQGRRIKNPRLRRGIFLLPSLFTVANLLCGYYAVVASLLGGRDNFDHAAKAIGFAILFDSLDGRVARMTGTNTEFGVQLDSLADVVSFGIAPAVMAYAWGVRSLPGDRSVAFQQIGVSAWVCCLAFLICCAWRLARFNVQGMAPGGSKNFVGMPTPAAAGVIAAFVHGFKTPIHDERWAMAWLFLAAVLGALMTSTIRYYSFKDIPWTRKQPSLSIVMLCLIVAVIWRYSEYALVILASTYAVAGVALHLVRFVRHRLVSRTA